VVGSFLGLLEATPAVAAVEAGRAGERFPRRADRDRLRPDQRGRSRMRRREFIAGLGSAAVWQVAARAQPAPVPIIGVLNGTQE
jgi:hypothetical protein